MHPSLRRDGRDRRPLRAVLGRVLLHQPDGALAYLRGILARSCHGSILSRMGPPTIPVRFTLTPASLGGWPVIVGTQPDCLHDVIDIPTQRQQELCVLNFKAGRLPETRQAAARPRKAITSRMRRCF